MNVEKADSSLSSELVKQYDVTDTPFKAVGINDEWFLTLGRFRITDPTATLEEQIKMTEGVNWQLLTTVRHTLIVANRFEESQKRAKTASFTAEQIREIASNKELGEAIALQIDNSEGNLKGNLAFAIAKAVLKQTKIKI